MTEPAPDRTASALVAVTAVAVFGYTVARAWSISLSHDEAFTFIHYMDIPWMSMILSGSNWHMLNSVLFRLSVDLFGPSEMAMRLPNLLAHAGFLVYGTLLLRRYLHGFALVCAAAILFTNPYLLDFFSCARGYGLGIAFLVAGIYYLALECSEPGTRHAARARRIAPWMFTLGALSNLVFLNVYGAYALVVAVLEIRERGGLRAAWRPSTAFGILLRLQLSPIVLALLTVSPIYVGLAEGEFYVGGHNGFWHDTVMSLVDLTLYDRHYVDGALNTVFAALVVALGCVSLIFAFVPAVRMRANADRVRSLQCMVALLFVPVALSMGEHYLASVNFLKGRMGIFYLPLFLITVVCTLGAIMGDRNRGVRAGALVLLVVLSAGSTMNLLKNANLTYFLDWRYDAHTRDALELVLADLHDEGRKSTDATLGAWWIYQPALLYYTARKGVRFANDVGKGGPDGTWDYYYFDREKAYVVQKYGLQIIREFPDSGSTLAKRRR